VLNGSLNTLVDHPLVLVIALVLAGPFIWYIGRSWFANIEEDVEDAVVPTIVQAAGGPTVPTWLWLKVFWFSVVSAAIVITFYKVGSWLADL
jgi:hypothetical protein